MAKTVINIKTDPQTKRELKEFAAELGVPVSVIINAQIKEALRSRTITLSTSFEPTPYLKKILRQVERDLKTGKNITRTNGIEQALAHLDSL